MSYIFVHVGQCGNQVGNEFWKLMCSERDKRKTKFPCFSLFHPDGKARCLLVDSEPKVVQSIIETSDYVDPKNVRFSYPGCGNNWGLGYNFNSPCECPVMPSSGTLLEETIHMVRLEIERCDYLKAIIVMHSLGGGTGSGFGCRIIEELREKYPAQYIVSICVAPYRHGDTPLQHYNLLFSLSHIQKFTDGIILFQNDDVLRSLNKDFSTSSVNRRLNKNSYSVSDVNKYISSCLVNLFMPMQDDKNHWRQFDIFSVMRTTCPDPRTKFLELHTSALLTHNSQSKTSWQYITEDLAKQIPLYDSLYEQQITALQSLVIVRGGVHSNYDYQAIRRTLLTKIVKPVAWIAPPTSLSMSRVQSQEENPENVEIVVSMAAPAICSTIKPIEYSLTVLLNRTHIIEFLNHVLVKSASMLESNAYVHWYKRHGCDRDHFMQSFEILKQTIQDYANHMK